MKTAKKTAARASPAETRPAKGVADEKVYDKDAAGDTVIDTPLADILRVDRLEHACALPELQDAEPLDPVEAGIQAFKDADRRTMHVVAVDGVLFKQEVF